jgi:hypothetical protein
MRIPWPELTNCFHHEGRYKKRQTHQRHDTQQNDINQNDTEHNGIIELVVSNKSSLLLMIQK